MIDWITGTFRCDHDPIKLVSGSVMSFDANGNNEWIVNKRLSVEGSYSSKIQVRSVTDSTIEVSGNPTKFLQGHNIFGNDDLQYIVGRFFDSLLKHDDLGLIPTDDQYHALQSGQYNLTRVDYNLSWHLSSRSDVLSWIRAAAQCANLKHRGSGQFSGDTLYFGKNSRHWSLKCYSKGDEINAKNHKLPKELQIPELIEWADKSLRLELVLRSPFLRSTRLNHGSNWTASTGSELLLSCIQDDLQISDNMPLTDDLLDTLPTRLKGVYSLWLAGNDLRSMYPKNTFYRYRKQLLPYGLDISIIQDNQRSNVVPLVRYLEAMPASIPDWAYKLNLVA